MLLYYTGISSLLLSLCEVQYSAPSGETAMCVMAAPRRGRKSRWFSWLYLHWTSTDSMPPLSRLVPGDTEQMYIKSSVLFHTLILSQNDQIILDCPFKNSCSGLKNGRIIKSFYLLGWSSESWRRCGASAGWSMCTPSCGWSFSWEDEY